MMDNIVTIAQTSVAVAQSSVAAGLLVATAFSVWKDKHLRTKQSRRTGNGKIRSI
jgi:hypothetical protein